MRFDLKSPCCDCPFRSDIGFFLHKGRRRDIAHALLKGDASFACHKTVDYSQWQEQGKHVAEPTEQHCAGALIVLKKMGALWDNLIPRFARMVGWFDPDRLNLEAPVYDSMEDFIAGK